MLRTGLSLNMTTSEVPDANDSEFYDNVISPLATGGYFEALCFIRLTPDSELYASYTRVGEDRGVVQNLELALDMHTDATYVLTATRRDAQYGE